MEGEVIDAVAWTGRPMWGGPLYHLRGSLRRWLFPAFDCADCTGTGAGCYCAYYGAASPGVGPELWRAYLRRLFGLHPPCG